MRRVVFLSCCLGACLTAQEADSGFELRTTLSSAAIYSHRLAQAPRSGSPLTAGFRGMLYPTWKLSSNWTVTGAVQVHTRPYFLEQLSTQGYGVKADVLQAHLSYSRVAKDHSLVVRIGQLSSSFGSFLLRYDDASNPLIDMPMTYGYYYKPITSLSLAGAQVDVTLGKLDARAQLANSSPANRRSISDNDQYANWSGGIGYTVVQGFRIGASAYRGPYLHRQYLYFRSGEANPREMPASAAGLDVQWGRGPWNASGELQWFERTYRAMPNFQQRAGYGELKRVLNARWYLAARLGHSRNSRRMTESVYEMAAGFRPNRHQLVKIGYQRVETPTTRGNLADSVVLQLVTAFRPISIARD